MHLTMLTLLFIACSMSCPIHMYLIMSMNSTMASNMLLCFMSFLRMISNMIAGSETLTPLLLYMVLMMIYYSSTKTSQALLWLEVRCFMFSLFCKTHKHQWVACLLSIIVILAMLNSSLKNYVIIMKILVKPKLLDKTFILVLPTNIFATWKKTFQLLLNHWESQWLLVDMSTPT